MTKVYILTIALAVLTVALIGGTVWLVKVRKHKKEWENYR